MHFLGYGTALSRFSTGIPTVHDIQCFMGHCMHANAQGSQDQILTVVQNDCLDAYLRCHIEILAEKEYSKQNSGQEGDISILHVNKNGKNMSKVKIMVKVQL